MTPSKGIAQGIGVRPGLAFCPHQVNVYYADRLVMSADLDFTISENPNFRFYFLPGPDGDLRVEAVDSTALRFEQAVAVPAPN